MAREFTECAAALAHRDGGAPEHIRAIHRAITVEGSK